MEKCFNERSRNQRGHAKFLGSSSGLVEPVAAKRKRCVQSAKTSPVVPPPQQHHQSLLAARRANVQSTCEIVANLLGDLPQSMEISLPKKNDAPGRAEQQHSTSNSPNTVCRYFGHFISSLQTCLRTFVNNLYTVFVNICERKFYVSLNIYVKIMSLKFNDRFQWKKLVNKQGFLPAGRKFLVVQNCEASNHIVCFSTKEQPL